MSSIGLLRSMGFRRMGEVYKSSGSMESRAMLWSVISWSRNELVRFLFRSWTTGNWQNWVFNAWGWSSSSVWNRTMSRAILIWSDVILSGKVFDSRNDMSARFWSVGIRWFSDLILGWAPSRGMICIICLKWRINWVFNAWGWSSSSVWNWTRSRSSGVSTNDVFTWSRSPICFWSSTRSRGTYWSITLWIWNELVRFLFRSWNTSFWMRDWTTGDRGQVAGRMGELVRLVRGARS